ncbi:MAG: HYR domain-containing protein [Saprospiraceae bacterium]|nr:HYR domain-containing protein [Saprospiraceae bacterium]
MRNILLILTIFASFLYARETTAQTVTFKADTVSISCSSTDTFLIPIRVVDFDSIGAFQFTLAWDTAKLNYAYTTPIIPELLGAGVDFDSNKLQINAGRIAYIWTKTLGASLPDSTVIFSLAFQRKAGNFAALTFVNSPVVIEAADVNVNILTFIAGPGGALPIDDEPPSITCPANVTVQGFGPTPVNGIAPASLADNCLPLANVGWASVGATVQNQPNDPDASGSPFNIGQSTVTYTATDVGNNTATCSFNVTVEFSLNTDSLTIIVQTATTSCSQTVSINITALNFDSIGSLQFSLGWNPAALQFSSVSNFNPALQLVLVDNFNTLQTNNGLLAFLWTANAAEGVTLPPGAILFTLNLNVLTGGGASIPLTFGDSPVIREVFSNASGTPEEIGAVWVNGTVNVADLIPPILECPGNVNIDLPPGNVNVQVNNLQPLALLDNCPGVPTLNYVQTGATTGSGTGNANGIYNPGVTTVTYTATDVAGNTSTCSFTVTVNAPGILTLLIDTVAVDCQGGPDQIAVNLFVENWNDIVGLQFQVGWDPAVLQYSTVNNFNPALGLMLTDFGTTQTDLGILSFFAGGPNSGWPDILPDGSVIFTIVFNVLNPTGISSIFYTGFIEAINSSINVVPVTTVNGLFSASDDNTPPSVECPPNITVDIIGNECNTNVNVPFPTVVDACSGIDTIVRVPSSDVFFAGVTNVTYTVTDSAGNSATCVLTVTVKDNTPPSLIDCPTGAMGFALSTVCAGQTNWAPPIPFDPCGQVGLVVTSNFNQDSLFPVGQTQVVYTVTDPSGNTGTCSFVVTIQDTIAPSIECPLNQTVPPDGSPNCGAFVQYPSAFVTDNCDTAVVVTSVPLPGIFPPGPTTVIYTATDDFNNVATCSFVVTVTDFTSPVLTCPPNVTITTAPDTCGAFVIWDDVTATDACDGTLTPTSNYNSGDYFEIGVTIVLYSATDASSNIGTCSFEITVTESTPPLVLGCPSNISITLPQGVCETTATWTPPVASDNCFLISFIASHDPGAVFKAGTTTVTYTAIDAAGNETVCSFNVTLGDNVPPVMSDCPSDVTVSNATPCGAPVTWNPPTATDNCTDSLVFVSSHAPGDTFYNGQTTVVIIVFDANGNFDSCHFVITVNTGNPPGFLNIPQNIVIPGCPQTVSWTPPTPTGFCELDTVFSSHQPGDFFPNGTTVVTYTWIEGTTQLPTSATFSVTILETEPPNITCPISPIVVNVGGGIAQDSSDFILSAVTTNNCSGVILELDAVTATDNCGIDSFMQTSGPLSGATFLPGLTTITYIAVDSSGNTSICNINIEVLGLPALSVMSQPTFGCLNQPVTITATAIAGATYTWTLNNQPLNTTGNTHIVQSFASANEGVYSVSAIVNGCTIPASSTTVMLAKMPDAIDDTNIFFTPGDTTVFNVFENDQLMPPSDFEVVFFDSLQGLAYLGEGNFAYVGQSGGFFRYRVCSKSCPNLCDDAAVTIRGEESCKLPNIFTPNGDEINDWLEIPCLADPRAYPNNSLVVYNQWGDKVYEASPYYNTPQAGNVRVPWRGTLFGNPGQHLPDATYFYIFKPGPGEPAIKGFIEIFR